MKRNQPVLQRTENPFLKIINEELNIFKNAHTLYPPGETDYEKLAGRIIGRQRSALPANQFNNIRLNWNLWLMQQFGGTKAMGDGSQQKIGLDQVECQLIKALIKKGITFDGAFVQLIHKLQNEQIARPIYTVYADKLMPIMVIFMTNKELFRAHMTNDTIKQLFGVLFKNSIIQADDPTWTALYSFFWELGVHHFLPLEELHSLLEQAFFAHCISPQQGSRTINAFYSDMLVRKIEELEKALPNQAAGIWLKKLIYFPPSREKMLNNFEPFRRLYHAFAQQNARDMCCQLCQLKMNNGMPNNFILNICDIILAIGISGQPAETKKGQIKAILEQYKPKDENADDFVGVVRHYFNECNKTQFDRHQRDQLLHLCQRFSKSDRFCEIIFAIEQEFLDMVIVDDPPSGDNENADTQEVAPHHITLSMQSRPIQGLIAPKYQPPRPRPHPYHTSGAQQQRHDTGRTERPDVRIRLPSNRQSSLKDQPSPTIRIKRKAVEARKQGEHHVPPCDDNDALNIPEPDALPYTTDLFQRYLKDKQEVDIRTRPRTEKSHPHKTMDPRYEAPAESHRKDRDKKETGIWGEAACFFNLIRKFKDKHGITETDEKKKDTIILQRKEATETPAPSSTTPKIASVTICWFNKSHWQKWRDDRKSQPDLTFVDQGLLQHDIHYDILLEKMLADGTKKTRFIEVKSTIRAPEAAIVMTGGEFDFMRAHSDEYRLFRCYGAKSAECRFVVVKNLKGLMEEASFKFEKMTCRI